MLRLLFAAVSINGLTNYSCYSGDDLQSTSIAADSYKMINTNHHISFYIFQLHNYYLILHPVYAYRFYTWNRPTQCFLNCSVCALVANTLIRTRKQEATFSQNR